MENKAIKLIIILGVIFAICIFIYSILLVVSTLPKSAVIKDDNIILITQLGGEHVIPKLEVTFQDNQSSIPPLIRVNGTSLGRYHSGHFRDRENNVKYYLFLKGTGHRLSFLYNDEICIVDFDD